MKTISIPFTFSDGGVSETSNLDTIVQSQIVDVLMTAPGERAISVGYGANVRSLLYEPIDNLLFDDFKSDAIAALNEAVDSGRVIDITISYPDSPQMAYPEDSSVEVSVRYIVPPYGGRVFTFNVSSDI